MSCVAVGNVLAGRSCVLALLCCAISAWWVLEQPAGSLFQEHVLFQELIRLVSVFRTHINMFDFGHAAPKPTWLYSGPGPN